MARDDLLTTAEAAALIGVRVRMVQTLIASKVLPAEKLGRDWFVRRPDAEHARSSRPKRGRPREGKPPKKGGQ